MVLSKSSLNGFVPAVVTPFDTDGNILEDNFKTLVEHLISCGANGICVAGDNGESWTLGPDERQRLTALAVEQSAGRAPVITGCSAAVGKQSVAYAKAAQAAGAAGLLAMPQTYVLKASRQELVDRFALLADSTDLPIVAYNSPRRAGIELSLDDLDAIMDVAPIIGIKESHRDFFHLTHLIEQFSERLSIMVGPSHYIMPGVALGAAGFIATGPELLGKTAGEIMSLARAAPTPKWAETHFKLTRIYELLMGLGTWPSAFKAALNLQGLPAGVPREPVRAMEGEALRQIQTTLADLGLLA